MNSRKNSYGTAASPLFPRFPLNPRSTIFVSYSLPSFPSPRPLPSLTVFSASPTLCVSSSRGNAYKKKFVAQKVLLHFFANNSLGKRRERDKEKNRLLVPGNLDRPRDFSPARRGGGKGGTNCRQNELTRARYLCPEGLKLMEDKQPVLNKLRVQPPFVCAGEKGEGFCGPTKYPVRCSPRCSRDNIAARISRIPLPSHFSANSENASRLNAKDELARFSSSSSSSNRRRKIFFIQASLDLWINWDDLIIARGGKGKQNDSKTPRKHCKRINKNLSTGGRNTLSLCA